ncbi:MAG: signal peptidase I [Patescibacteria group bacterium]|jgi:signal peptidase I|nr:signal peptidase I [Patescibacteria group bacterium]
MKEPIDTLFDIIKVILIALLIVIPVRYFLFQPFVVNGQSMEPNYSNGDYLIVDEISYRFKDPVRGDVIVFRYPQNPSLRHIKRVIGLPNETIRINDNGVEIISEGNSIRLDENSYLPFTFMGETMEISLGDDEFFVMGDNRQLSFDSRRWGALSREYILGKVLIRVASFNKAEVIGAPIY